MRVLVTGAAGFIGSHLCDYLLGLGHEVAGIDILVPQVHGGKGLQWGGGNTVPTWPGYMDPRVESMIMDVGNRREVLHALGKFQPEIVIHLAAFVGVGQSWYEPSMYLYGGGVITAALFEAIAHHNTRADTKVRRVFVAGSMSCYGEGPVGMDEAPTGAPEDWPLDPQNPYAMAKADGERIALMLAPRLGVEAVVGRFFNVMGSRQALTNPYTGVGAIFSALLLSGKAPVVFEDGRQSRDFVHVSDVVRAIWTIVEQAPAGEVYNVGTGTRTTILELAQRLCEVHGGGLEPLVTGISRAGDIRHCVADPSKLKALGWEPKVSLDAAVEELWGWVGQQAVDDPDAFARAFGELAGRGLVAVPEGDPQAEVGAATPQQE
jgi:dTDP-L-rhamnose 4-epimerase